MMSYNLERLPGLAGINELLEAPVGVCFLNEIRNQLLFLQEIVDAIDIHELERKVNLDILNQLLSSIVSQIDINDPMVTSDLLKLESILTHLKDSNIKKLINSIKNNFQIDAAAAKAAEHHGFTRGNLLLN